MFGLPGHWEIVIVALVLLLIFGPKQLPRLGRSLGGFVRGIKDCGNEVRKIGDGFEEDE